MCSKLCSFLCQTSRLMSTILLLNVLESLEFTAISFSGLRRLSPSNSLASNSRVEGPGTALHFASLRLRSVPGPSNRTHRGVLSARRDTRTVTTVHSGPPFLSSCPSSTTRTPLCGGRGPPPSPLPSVLPASLESEMAREGHGGSSSPLPPPIRACGPRVSAPQGGLLRPCGARLLC